MAVEIYPGIAFSPKATLTDGIGPGDTIIPVSNVNVFPDAPNFATIGTDENGETIMYSAKTDSALSGCTRGVEGTAKSWAKGEGIARNFTNKDFEAIRTSIEDVVKKLLKTAKIDENGNLILGLNDGSEVNAGYAKGDKGDTGANGQDGAKGETGAKGDPGEAATIRIGTVSSGSTPSVTNSGTETDAVLNFVLQKGDKGDKGDQGEQGPQGPEGPEGQAPSSFPASSITGTLAIANGGTGVSAMAGTDYSTNRPRGIILQSSTPYSVQNGCLVGVYE